MNNAVELLKRCLRAFFAAVLTAGFAAAVLSVVLSKTGGSERLFAISASILPYMAVFVFSAAVSRGAKKNGWLCGGGAGVLCALLLLAAGCAFFKNAPTAPKILRAAAISFAVGAFGGIVGINTARQKM